MMVFLVPGTQAADEVSSRDVYQNQKVETMEVGDIPGHVVGVVEQLGLILISNQPGLFYLDSTSTLWK